MRTPFIYCFDQAIPMLSRISKRPFVPTYPMPFIQPTSTAYYVGGNCQFIYRWHDAFDVFIAVLDAVLLQPTEITVESHYFDMHLVYQLRGNSNVIPEPIKHLKPPPVLLASGQRMEAYTPPTRARLQLLPDSLTNRYTLATVVPKSGWVTRHSTPGESPMEALIGDLEQGYAGHRYLIPAPITPTMHAWLHLLLSTPPYAGMTLDNALNGPMVKLVETHRGEHLRTAYEKRSVQIANTARELVKELVAQMDSSKPITVDDVAAAMCIPRYDLWKAHSDIYQSAISHYINEQVMQRAKELLAAGKNVKEVGMVLGYSTPNNFSRSFKKMCGISPDAYRRRGGNKNQ